MFRRFLAATLLFAVAGCGPEVIPTSKVKGTVKFNGEPVADAAIVFVPEKGRTATGKTDASGVYSLTTETPGDGAALGKHQVTITKMGPPDGMTAEAYEKLKTSAGAGTVIPPGKSAIPEKYSQFGTSGLSATVEGGKENTIDFDLK